MTPKEVIQQLREKLESLGITELSVNHSSTDFGNSSYLYAGLGAIKIRCSDHSVTSNSRILNEVHIDENTIDYAIEIIEKYYFPEKFKKVVTIEFGDEHSFPKDKLHTIKCDYEVLIDVDSVTKKGREMSLIRKRNKEVTKYIRK